MSTKNDPGEFDCYAAVAPDEEMFVLLGRDPMAGPLVRLWASARLRAGEDKRKVAEAFVCAAKLDNWCEGRLGKTTMSVEQLVDLALGRPR